MSSTVMVKVVGFSDVERHSLNTLFRLSTRRDPSYTLWHEESLTSPHVALLDMDSYEGSMDLESPSFNPHMKFIAIGKSPPAAAWRSFQRPVDWVAMVNELDNLFAPATEVDFDLGLGDGAPPERKVPPGVTVCLLVGLSRDERMYLRARMALAGLTEVDEADTGVQASYQISARHYDLVIVSLELADANAWSLVEALEDMANRPRSVVVATQTPTWAAMERADKLGCAGLIEIPFNPRQVMAVLQKI